jgi:hypothetical protein
MRQLIFTGLAVENGLVDPRCSGSRPEQELLGVRPDEVAARTVRSRGRLVREIAARTHQDPSGRPVRVSRDTLDRWIRVRRAGGFDGVVLNRSSNRLATQDCDELLSRPTTS